MTNKNEIKVGSLVTVAGLTFGCGTKRVFKVTQTNEFNSTLVEQTTGKGWVHPAAKRYETNGNMAVISRATAAALLVRTEAYYCR